MFRVVWTVITVQVWPDHYNTLPASQTVVRPNPWSIVQT